MPHFMTVSLECRNEDIRQSFEALFNGHHREFVFKNSKSAGDVDLLVLELDESQPQRTFSDIRRLLDNAPHTEIVLTAKRTDPQLLLEAFRIGVKEFLPQPLNPHEGEQAIARIQSRFGARAQPQGAELGTVISVIGAKAGIGTSTVALNLATALKKGKQPRSVVLVDLNLYSNDLALFLDMATPRGLRDLAGDLSRLDTTILKNLLVTHTSGIQLLAAGYQEPDDTLLPPGCVLHTLDTLRTMFQFVVVDCGSTLELSTREAAELSLRMVVVSQLSVPTIRRTKRLLQQLQQYVQNQGRVTVAVNRYVTKEAVLLKETEDVLGQKVAWLIPNDYAIVSKAIDSGTPLIQLAPRSGITQQYCRQAETLAQELAPANEQGRSTEEKKKESLLSKYLPLFSNGKTTSQVF